MWRPVRSKPGPGCLHSHTAVKFLNAMLLFGGEREGQTLNELWKFHFGKKYNLRKEPWDLSERELLSGFAQQYINFLTWLKEGYGFRFDVYYRNKSDPYR